MKNLRIAVISVVSVLILSNCKKETVDVVDCSNVTPTYNTNVKALLDKNCSSSGCHDASSKKAGYDLSSYSGANAASKNTEFLGSIQHKSGYSKMPRGGSKLSDADIKTITCWVQNNSPQ